MLTSRGHVKIHLDCVGFLPTSPFIYSDVKYGRSLESLQTKMVVFDGFDCFISHHLKDNFIEQKHFIISTIL